MTVNDVLDLVNFHGLNTPGWAVVLGLAGAVGIVSFVFLNVVFDAVDFPDYVLKVPSEAIHLVLVTAIMITTGYFIHEGAQGSLRLSSTDMSPSEALSVLYDVEIDNIGTDDADDPTSRERLLLLHDTEQSGYRATIDGEVRALTIETIGGEYRITYVDSEQLVEVSPR